MSQCAGAARGRFVLGEEILSPAAIWAHRRPCAMAIPPLRHPHRTRCNNTARRYPSRLHPRPAIVRTRRTSSIHYASHSPQSRRIANAPANGLVPRRRRGDLGFGGTLGGVGVSDSQAAPPLSHSPPQPSAQGERAAEFAARADSSLHEHALAASDAGRVVNGV